MTIFHHTPRFSPGDSVTCRSKTSKRKGSVGVILRYCSGRYTNICAVQFSDGAIRNFFDTSLEPLK